MDKNRDTVFTTKLTPKLVAMLLVPLGAAAALAYEALDAHQKFAPTDNFRYLFVGIPALVSVSLILTVMGICSHFLGRTITIRDEQLYYKDSKVLMTLELGEMAFSPPSTTSVLRALMFSDGSTFIQMPMLFMGEKEFVHLNKLIKKRRRTARAKMDQKTYGL